MAELLPLDDREGSLWFDGKLIPWRDAKIHILTHGLHYASCVFEGERYYDRRVYKLKEHTERLFESARILDIEIPFGADEIDRACNETIAAHPFDDGYVRPVVFRGSEMLSVAGQRNRVHVGIAVWQWPSYFDAATKMKGIRLDISQWKRPAPDCAPSKSKAAGLYMIATLSKHAAEAKGYADALMYDYRGLVAESTGANIMFVKDGELHTPAPDCFLDSITRRVVQGLAAKHQIKVDVRHILPEELSTFSEAFLTGTAAEVTPISEIGPYRYKPGEISKMLMQDYSEEVRQPVSGVEL
jgi:branched-chain amino acid aminotransferase